MEPVTEEQEESEMSGDETSEVAGDESEDEGDGDEDGSDNDQDEDDLDEDDMDMDEMDDEEEEEQEEAAAKKQQPKEVEKTQEDLEFESMFDRMTMDSFQERARETTVKPVVKEIIVPVLGKSTKKTYENLHKSDEPEEKAGVAFVLMTRGGKAGKQQLKAFSAPADSQLAVNLKLQEQKIREEHESVKR